MPEIPVTYQCWGCGSEELVFEETDKPIPTKTIWNLCKECQKERMMANYTGKQSVLDEALGEFKDFGFSLVEPDDHVIELYFKDKKIATYNQSKLTIPILHEGCGNYLKSIMGEL